jgi:phosphoglycerate dehydrogenase-like enzyme
VHSLAAGIDSIVAIDSFRNSPIPLTNAKGAYSEILGEFVALGVLYHAKKLENFLKRKENAHWEPEPVHFVKKKHMVIVGYGDIG